MTGNEERISLILEANDRATASLQRIRKEIEATRGASVQGAAATQQAARNTEIYGRHAVTSARAMSSLAFAAENATLGTRGAVLAVGQLSQVAAIASVKMAAFAPHIAAATIVAGTLLTVFQRIRDTKREAADIDPFLQPGQRYDPTDPVWGVIRQQAKDDADAARTQEEIKRRREAAVERRNAMLEQLNQDIAFAQAGAGEIAELRLRATATANERELRILEQHGADVAELRLANERLLNTELGRVREAAVREWLSMQRELGDRLADLDAERRGAHEELVDLRISREHRAREEAIRAMHLDHEAESALLAQAEAIRTAQLEAAERQRVSTVARAAREKREAQIAGIMAVVRSGESAGRIAARIALEPIAKHLEGVAIEQAVKAAAAFMNPPVALRHAAAAALAIAGAAKVSSLAGGGSSGGGGFGGGGGSPVGVGAFEPRGAAGSGGVHLTIITRDRGGRETVQQTLHDLQRAQVLKLPAFDMRVGD